MMVKNISLRFTAMAADHNQSYLPNYSIQVWKRTWISGKGVNLVDNGFIGYGIRMDSKGGNNDFEE
jgi:hypothetical protein